MFKLLHKIPRKINLAFSGGVDSLAVAHFLKRGRHDVHLLHLNHGCEYSNGIAEQCVELSERLSLPITVGTMTSDAPNKGQSLEDYWRRSRYRFLRSFDDKFITCHHLDDAMETWVFTSCHGESKLIPSMDEKVIRPFLTTEKQKFIEYAEQHNLTPVDDPYNRDYDLTRNYIRANIMPHALKVNPGLSKVIRKKYLALSNN
jgi:tRNA(Ile)-lysidine synthase